MGKDDKKEPTNAELFDLIQKLVTSSAEIKKQNEEIKEELLNVKEEVSAEIQIIKEENKKLQSDNKKLKEKIADTERKLKKFNLIFWNIQEKDTHLEDLQFLLEVINKKIKVDCRSNDLRDSYRKGKKTENGRPRPLVVEFLNYHHKQDILAKSKNLAGTNLGVSADLIPEDNEKQKYLRTQLKKARQEGKQAKIRNFNLIVDSHSWSYEELKKKQLEKREAIGETEDSSDSGEEELSEKETEPSTKRRKQQSSSNKSKATGKNYRTLRDRKKSEA